MARDKALRSLGEKQAALRTLLGDDTDEDIEEAHRAVSVEFVGLKAKMEEPELSGAGLSPGDFQELLSRMEQLDAQHSQFEEDARQAQSRIDAAGSDPDEVAALEGRLQGLGERQAFLEERLQVRQLARDVIEEARSRKLGEVTDAIAPQIGELLAQLTGHRYCEVGLDSDMRPSVTCPCGTREIHLGPEGTRSELSCATREQIFLAARLALVDMLWPEGGPPVLMDDPLVNFDTDRRKAAIEVLRSAAERHQIIVFTCGDDFADAADNVVHMPAPA